MKLSRVYILNSGTRFGKVKVTEEDSFHLVYRVLTKSGSLSISLIDENKSVIYERKDVTTGEYDYIIPKGKFTLVLKTRRHTGGYSVWFKKEKKMSKYESLWKWIKDAYDGEDFAVSFETVEEVCGFKIDHSFLNAKKELKEFGFEIVKISLKDKYFLVDKIDKK